ncbi:sialate O-acetylesterase [Weeksellaceae bacterium A-14]
MVLQRNTEIVIWGRSIPNENIRILFRNQNVHCTADRNGNWKTTLQPIVSGGPYEMTIKGNRSESLTLKNILVGDVWLASGQSNMEWNLAGVDGYQEELKQEKFPLIRHIKIQRQINSLPQESLSETHWEVANSSTIGDFSATAYFFAKKMFEETGVPIGIINSSWGGTVIESWIPRDAFEQSSYFREMISKMPKINIEELQKRNIKGKTDFFEKLTKTRISDFKEKQFLSNSYDDKALAEIYVPKPWENQGYTALDGIIWVRKTIELTDEDLKGDAIIHLGQIDDEDITYFNGKEIGRMKQWSDERVYTVPASILQKGKNTIAIRIVDTGGGGGLWSAPEFLKLQTTVRTLPLAGKWKMAIQKIFTDIDQNEFPSLIYNSMIHPLINTKISGIIWYQGESNIERAFEYNKSFPLLIESWRQLFGDNLPFYYVQIATYNSPGDSNIGCPWAELRDAQLNTLKIKNTGMVVTTDIGNPENIHPRNKMEVGKRLAMLALSSYKSPVYLHMQKMNDSMRISFTPDVKLSIRNSDVIKGFEIAGPDKIFHKATARLDGHQVVVYSDQVKEPVSVRYGWKGDDAEINLITDYGLPVSPFRTDNFDLSTKENYFKFDIFK